MRLNDQAIDNGCQEPLRTRRSRRETQRSLLMPDECDRWLSGSFDDAVAFQMRCFPDDPIEMTRAGRIRRAPSSSRLSAWRPALHEFAMRAAALLRRRSLGRRALDEFPVRVATAICGDRRRCDHSDSGQGKGKAEHWRILSLVSREDCHSRAARQATFAATEGEMLHAARYRWPTVRAVPELTAAFSVCR